jgi:hypothetical protein
MTLACISFRLYWLQWYLCIYPNRNNMMHYGQDTQLMYLQLLSSFVKVLHLLGYCTVSKGSLLLMFWDNMWVQEEYIFLDILPFTLSQNATNKTLNDAAKTSQKIEDLRTSKTWCPTGHCDFLLRLHVPPRFLQWAMAAPLWDQRYLKDQSDLSWYWYSDSIT